MGSGIERIPVLDQGIIDAVNNEELAVFIGAGASRLAGCKGWDELAKSLTRRCFDESLINYKEKEAINRIEGSRKVITICKGLMTQKGKWPAFLEEMQRALGEDKEIDAPNVYDDIYKLRGVFVTTNADTLFHRCFTGQHIHFRLEDLDADNIAKRNLYHLHGCISEPDTMVFTLQEYFTRYQKPAFQSFLQKLFSTYTVLFVGYGLEEYELLEQLCRHSHREQQEARRFMLKPFYSGEDRLLQFEQTYFQDMHVIVKGFQKDETGYAQLEHVLEDWNSRLNRLSGYLHSTFSEIDEICERSPAVEAQEKLLQIMRNDQPLENYAFKRLKVSTAGPQWLPVLESAHYFSGDKNPRPREVERQPGYYTIPQWNVLPYLEKVAQENKHDPENGVTKTLVEIVNEIVEYRDKDGNRIENYRTDWYITKILFCLPSETWEKKHRDFLGEALKDKFGGMLIQEAIGEIVLPALIAHEQSDLVTGLLEVILSFRVTQEHGRKKAQSLMDEHWLRAALGEDNTEGISRLCWEDALSVAVEKIKGLHAVDDGSISSIFIPSIEESIQTRFPDKYGAQLVSFARNLLEKQSAKRNREIVAKMLQDEPDVLKRLGIHTIRCQYGELADLFWGWPGNPLEDVELFHEVYILLEERAKELNSAQIKQVREWIEALGSDRDPDEREEHGKYLRRRWLAALKETDDERIETLRKEYGAGGGETERRSFKSWSEAGMVVNTSPLALEKMERMTNQEIAGFLKDWKEKDVWELERISREGLSDVLKRCVKGNPQKFAEELSPFASIPLLHQRDLIQGFRDAWGAGTTFNVRDVLSFIRQIIGERHFWEKEYEEKAPNYRNWVISEIARFVEAGVRTDEHAFEKEALADIENVLLTLAEKAASTVDEKQRHAISSVIGSPRGSVLSAMVLYSLRYARVVAESRAERWPRPIRDNFTQRLDHRTERSIDFSVTLGKFLPTLVFLDKNWVYKNLERIFPKEMDRKWKAAFGAYVSYTGPVYKEIYEALREKGLYAKALRDDFEEEQITESLVQHICIGFLEGWERVEDKESLMSELLRLAKVKQLSAVVHFLGGLEEEGPRKKLKDRIKPLWKAIGLSGFAA